MTRSARRAALAFVWLARHAAAQQTPPSASAPPSVTIVQQNVNGACNNLIHGDNNKSTFVCTIEGIPRWPFFVAGITLAGAGTVVALHANHVENEQLKLDPYQRDPSVQNSLKKQDFAASALLIGGGTAIFFGLALWLTPAVGRLFGGSASTVTPWATQNSAGVTAVGNF